MVLALVAACAGGHPEPQLPATPLRASDAPGVTADSRRVVATQLAHWASLPLDDALDRADPQLLRAQFRGREVLVYIDRMPSTFADLHQIPARMVAEVKLMAEDEAQMELGPLVWQPVLEVRLRHGER